MGGAEGGGRKIAVGKQTAIAIRVETPVRHWVNVGMLFKDEYMISPLCHDS